MPTHKWRIDDILYVNFTSAKEFSGLIRITKLLQDEEWYDYFDLKRNKKLHNGFDWRKEILNAEYLGNGTITNISKKLYL